MPMFGTIGVSMCERHPKYAAAAAIFPEIADHFALENSPDTPGGFSGGTLHVVQNPNAWELGALLLIYHGHVSLYYVCERGDSYLL